MNHTQTAKDSCSSAHPKTTSSHLSSLSSRKPCVTISNQQKKVATHRFQSNLSTCGRGYSSLERWKRLWINHAADGYGLWWEGRGSGVQGLQGCTNLLLRLVIELYPDLLLGRTLRWWWGWRVEMKGSRALTGRQSQNLLHHLCYTLLSDASHTHTHSFYFGLNV